MSKEKLPTQIIRELPIGAIFSVDWMGFEAFYERVENGTRGINSGEVYPLNTDDDPGAYGNNKEFGQKFRVVETK